jgi:hypothetical protein
MRPIIERADPAHAHAAARKKRRSMAKTRIAERIIDVGRNP